MHRKVTIGEGEHFRVDDVSNLAAFPQEGDELLTQDWLGTLRYRGLTVTKDGANAVVVAPGSAYVAFRQFALADPVSVSLVDEKPLIAGQKRVVVLAAQGAGDRPAAAVPRDKTVDVPDGNGGSVSQDIVATVAPYVANIIQVAKIAGGLSTQEVEPVVPADVVPFCRIVLDTSGIVGDVQMNADTRIKSVNDLDAIIRTQGLVIDQVLGQVSAIQTTLVAVQAALNSSVSFATLDAVIYDVATIKDQLAIGDTGAPYALDRFANADEVNTEHVDFKGRVDEGFQAPYAAADEVALSLFSPNDIRLMHQDKGVLFPAYDPVVGYKVETTGANAPLGGSVTQTMTLTKVTTTHTRVRYGGYFNYMVPVIVNRLRADADIVYRIFGRPSLAWAYPYGYYIDRYRGWKRYFRRRVIVDTVTETYDVWQKSSVVIQGVIKAQTWQQGQERFIPAIRLGLLSWDSGAEVTVAICKTRADGSPDPDQVIDKATVAAAAFKKYVKGNADTMTRFAFPTPVFAERGTLGMIISTSGNVTAAMASGDQFLGGNYFESTDGIFFVGSITQDLAHAVEYCQFRATAMDIRLNNLSLSGGVEGMDVSCPGVFPDTTSALLQAFAGGEWKTMAQLPPDESATDTDTDEILGTGTGATYDFRAYLTGTEWVMPVLDLGRSERSAFRADDDWHYVSVAREVPSGTTWAKVVATARLAKYDADRHTLTATLKHGAALGSTKAADGDPAIAPVPGNDAVDATWTFTVDPSGDKYELHITGATDNIAVPLSMTQVFSKVEA
jgi:hypothetical protein